MVEHSQGGNGQQAQEATFDFIKSEYFRVIHADGAIGGPTPQGHIHVAFYSERPPLPRRIVQPITPAGILGEAIPEKTVMRDAIVREVDVDVMMTYPVALQLHQWLGQKLEDLQKLMGGHT